MGAMTGIHRPSAARKNVITHSRYSPQSVYIQASGAAGREEGREREGRGDGERGGGWEEG